MDTSTVQQHRTKTVSDAAAALELSRDGLNDAADKLSDLTAHDAVIARARFLADEVERLRTDMAACELQYALEAEELRREAHAAAKQSATEDEAIARLDDAMSDYVDDREAD